MLANGIVLLVAFSVLLFSSVHADVVLTPQGWHKTYDQAKNTIIYRPIDTNSGLDLIIKYYPKTLLENQTIKQWLVNKLSSSKPPAGQWSGKPLVIKQTSNLSSGQRFFVRPDGSKGHLQVAAVSVDKQYVRLAANIHTDSDAYKPYKAQAQKLLIGIIATEKSAALAENRGLSLEKAPPKVAGIRAGGTLKAGRYVGAKTKDNKVKGHYEVILFDNGEYEFLKGANNKSGSYSYSRATGKLDIAKDFVNSNSRPKEDFCIYGIQQTTGKPVIYAEDHWGLGTDKFRLVWSNPVDRPSPSTRKKAAEMAEAEKNRYKYVTNPGNGVRDGDIETILLTSDTKHTVGEIGLEQQAYLIMTDGRVMDGIPVAPNILDIAKSRSREPDRWGWWKRDGNKYKFAWGVDQKKFVIPQGSQSKARPIPAGTRLDGTWSSSSSYAVGEFSSVSFWGVKFSKKGRFLKYRNGMMQGGGEMSGMGPLVTNAWNDEGSVVSVIGSNIGGGTKKNFNNPNADRMGWYEFDGYNLTLKFDNGSIERLASFSTDNRFDTIWFKDGTLRRKK